jgi:organic radical activating enzyme
MHRDNKQYDPKVELRRVRVSDVAEEVQRIVPRQHQCVVVTGGEPMLQLESVYALWSRMGNRCFEVETAGTIAPMPEHDPSYQETLRALEIQWNVSPKLAHSGNEHGLRYKEDVLRAFAALPQTMFKFVVQDATDVHEIIRIITDCNIQQRQVWLMPQGDSASEQLGRLKAVTNLGIEFGWNVSPRLHTLVWGNKRGH